MENTIYTQSRWVLKGQICNLLTHTDVLFHLAPAWDEIEKGRNWFGVKKGREVNSKVQSYNMYYRLHISVSYFEGCK